MPQVECWIVIDEDGKPVVMVKNLSGEPIPAGPNVQIVMGDGSQFHVKTWEDWPPGHTHQLGQPGYDGPMTCTATIDIEEDEDDVPH